MNNAVGVQVCEAVQNTLCNLSENLFPGAATQLLDLAVHRVQGSTLAENHGDADGTRAIVYKGAPVTTYVITCAVLVERELSYDLFLDVWVRIRCDDLVM